MERKEKVKSSINALGWDSDDAKKCKGNALYFSQYKCALMINPYSSVLDKMYNGTIYFK